MKITRNEAGVAPVAKTVTASLDDAQTTQKVPNSKQREQRETSSSMQALQQQLQEMPEVDETFVSVMQDALKSGRLKVNTDELAQAMLDFYQS